MNIEYEQQKVNERALRRVTPSLNFKCLFAYYTGAIPLYGAKKALSHKLELGINPVASRNDASANFADLRTWPRRSRALRFCPRQVAMVATFRRQTLLPLDS
jgi:hypothetical protein